jgi:hypothetical protein
MPKIGEQGDVLRAIGRFLDDEGASGIDIRAHEVFLAISWQSARPGGAQRSYQEHELDALRAQARFLRTGGGGPVRETSFAELMRTLGQELDEVGMELTALIQEGEGFRVSGIDEGIYRTRLCFFSELYEASARHRAKRGTGREKDPEEIDPFLGVSVGAPVFTKDNQRVGKVGAVTGRSFKVDTPFLQKDFWLPSTCIAGAAYGQPVLLSVYKSELDPIKRANPPTDEDGTGA